MTSEPLFEIKFLNLWKSLRLHHLGGIMSLVSFDLVICPLDTDPKLLHVILNVYLSVFLDTPCKNFTLKGMKKNIYGSKVSLQTNKIQNIFFPKLAENVTLNHYWFNALVF